MTATMSPANDDPFSRVLQQRKQGQMPMPQSSAEKAPQQDPFARVLSQKGRQEKPESGLKYAARTALQIPQGLLEGTVGGLAAGIWQLLAQGEVLDPEDEERLRDIYRREGKEFPEEQFQQAQQTALGTVPTVHNIAHGIEEATGIPLEAKTKGQKALRTFGLGYKAFGQRPKVATQQTAVREIESLPAKQRALFDTNISQPLTNVQKATGAGAGTAVSQGLQAAGVPEQFADILGLSVGGAGAALTPAAEVTFTKTKPSGLKARGFEKLQEPRAVPEERIQKINDKLEGDFRELSDKIIKEAPIGETAEQMANNPKFRQERNALMDEVETQAEAIGGEIESTTIAEKLLKRASEKVEGLALTEKEKSYANHVMDIVKDLSQGKLSLAGWIRKYREFNDSLKGYFEPGKSSNLNQGKRDAILEVNRAIADAIEETNPELGKIFRRENAEWSKMMDAQFVDELIGDIFPESVGGAPKRVNFKQIRDVFDKKGYKNKLIRALGEEGYKKFEQLLEDMLTNERPYKMLRVAEKMGFSDLVKIATKYGIGFVAGKPAGFIAGITMGTRQLMKSIVNSMMDKPQLGLNLSKAVNELKKGNFREAQTEFAKVDEIVAPKREAPFKAQGEEIKIKPTNRTAKQTAIDAFNDYGLTSVAEEAIEQGFVSKIEELAPYLRKNFANKVARIEEDVGKSIEDVIKDIYGKEKTSSQTKPAASSEPRQIEAKAAPEAKAKPEPLKPSPVESMRESFDKMASEKPKEEASLTKRKAEAVTKKKGEIEERKAKKNKIREEAKAEPKSNVSSYPHEYEYATIEHLKKMLVKETEYLQSAKKQNAGPLLIEYAKRRVNEIKEAIKEKVKAEAKPKAKAQSAPAAEQVEAKGEAAAKRPDITKEGLKKQKQYILNEVENALATPSDKRPDKIEIDVPGDGQFKLHKGDEALKTFKERVEKNWPDKPLRKLTSRKHI